MQNNEVHFHVVNRYSPSQNHLSDRQMVIARFALSKICGVAANESDHLCGRCQKKRIVKNNFARSFHA